MVFAPQLRVPGPTPLPDRVIRAASQPLINHRGPEFSEMLGTISSHLRKMLFTSGHILLIPGSGTYGLEAAVANLMSPGDTGLFCTNGYFGERWVSIAQAYGVNVIHLDIPWGEVMTAEDISTALSRHPEVTTVFVTHNETSTGITNPLEDIAKVVADHNRIFAVDSVSGAGALPVHVDELGIDVLVTASQKGWMAPPGLAMVAASDRALAVSKKSKSPKWTFDFERFVSSAAKGMTPTTPPLSVYYALAEGLAMMDEEGIERVWGRHNKVATMIRTGVLSMGLKLFAPEGFRSNAVTAVRSPAPDAESLSLLLADLREKYGLILAGGQGEQIGKIFRIGHLGYMDEQDVYGILGALECALFDHGYLSRIGFAVPAAQTTSQAWVFGQELVTADR